MRLLLGDGDGVLLRIMMPLRLLLSMRLTLELNSLTNFLVDDRDLDFDFDLLDLDFDFDLFERDICFFFTKKIFFCKKKKAKNVL